MTTKILEQIRAQKQLVLKRSLKIFVHKYLEVSPINEDIIIEYALQTWEPLPNHVKYLQFLGAPATGKTRAAHVMEALCFNPLYPGLSTSTAIMTWLNKNSPATLILDDPDISMFGGDINRILNAGAEKSSGTILKIMHPFEILSYSIFGYKVICSTKLFSDPAIQSKCITIKMGGSKRSDLPISLGDDFKRDREEIRGVLSRYFGDQQ